MVILIVSPVRKDVPLLWGKGVGPGRFPLLRAIPGGHRNVHRQSQASEHKQGDATPEVFMTLAINKGNTTDGRLLLPIAPDLFRILPSRV